MPVGGSRKVVKTGSSGNWGFPRTQFHTSVEGLLVLVKISQTSQEFKKKQVSMLNVTVFGILHFIKVFTKYKVQT